MRRWTRPLAGLALVSFTACMADQTTLAPDGTAEVRGVASSFDGLPAGTPIKDRYIVVFRDDVRDPSAEADALMRGRGGEIHYRYSKLFRGFAATVPAQAIQAIRSNPRVAYVEQDAVVTTAETTPITQFGATWGLDRIDQRLLPLNGSYGSANDGAGVTAYIVDTGILTSHSQFGGRASVGIDVLGGSGQDCNGHGTHVAGTVGGLTWGVSKSVSLKAVRVLNCRGSGNNSGVIYGLEWIGNNATPPAVVNMSLGSSFSAIVNSAVQALVDKKVTVVVAAGNSSANACNYSPASAAGAITVGATTQKDSIASYSNFGSCVDIFAPGTSITSAWHTSSIATNTISGTSMASPHVAGAVALHLELYPDESPLKVIEVGTKDGVGLTKQAIDASSPNILLYSNFTNFEVLPSVLRVTKITGFASPSKSSWNATATFTVFNADNTAASGATITALLEGAATGEATCLTDANGGCSIQRTRLSNSIPSVTFTVKVVKRGADAFDAANSMISYVVTKP